jgi:hypothetical protein
MVDDTRRWHNRRAVARLIRSDHVVSLARVFDLGVHHLAFYASPLPGKVLAAGVDAVPDTEETGGCCEGSDIVGSGSMEQYQESKQ